MNYTLPSKEVTEEVVAMFSKWKVKEVTEEYLVQYLNDLQDAGKINEKDREVLGCRIVFAPFIDLLRQ
jgi:hypothetical protein